MESVVFSGIADHWHYSNTSLFSFFYYNHIISSSPSTVFMATREELEMLFIAVCIEGFFYGKISVPCALTCTFAKEVQLFLGIGLYSGIFAMYLRCSLTKSKTATILFYALCLLYVLSTATIASDIVSLILRVSNNPICKNIIFYISCAVVYQY